MKVIKSPLGYLQENVYLAFCENTNEGVLIDPGSTPDKIFELLEENNVTLKYIILTHAHFDHIEAIPEIKKRFDVPVVLHKDEQEILGNSKYSHSGLYGGMKVELAADIMLEDGDELTFGDESLKIIHTPGHTPGGACYYSENARVLFTGDTLFKNEVGRCDLYKGNLGQLINEIKTKLLILPDDVAIFPGHSENSTIGREKSENSYVRLDRK